MKTIIAATDFTASSHNACRYAAMLAGKLNCKLTLFNLFEAPVIHSNMGLYGISYTSQRQLSEHRSQKLVDDLQKEFPKLKINYFVTGGAFKEELRNFVSRHLVEATVMGLKTKDKISKFIYGSHGVNVAGKIASPVIIVPEHYRNHKLARVVLAVDNSEKLRRSSLLPVERFAKQTKCIVEPVHVRTQFDLLTPVQKNVKLNGRNLDILNLEAKDIQDGVKKCIRESKSDMIVTVSKDHSAIYNLFVESNTKKIAFVAKVPVMVIHE